MPGSDRSLVVAAVFGLIAIPFGFGLALGGDWASKPYEQTQKPYASTERYRAQPLDTRFAAYPAVESNRCYGAKDHDSADLCAQWRAAIAAEKAADSARWSNYLSVIGAIISLAGLGFIIRSLRQTDRALVAAAESNEISRNDQRAWLTVEISPAYPLSYSSDGKPYTRVYVKNTNIGRMPAFNVKGKVEIMPVINNGPSFLARQRELSDYVRARQNAEEIPGQVLMPNESQEYIHILELTDEQTALINCGVGHERWFSLAIIGCVGYRIQGGGVGYTGFIFDLYRRHPQSGSSAAFDPTLGTVPIENMMMCRCAYGCDVA